MKRVTTITSLLLLLTLGWAGPSWAANTDATAGVPLTLRVLSGESVAASVWLLPDHTTLTVRLTQQEYDAWDKTGDAPGRPTPDAIYLAAMGGIHALAGGDGWPRTGDAWEQRVGGRTRLIVALSDELGWGYVRHDVADPVDGFSHVTGFAVTSTERRLVLDQYDLTHLPIIDRAAYAPRTNYQALDFQTPNHHSVSYGSSTTYFDNGTYPTGFSYAGPSISGSDTHLIVAFAIDYGSAPTAVTHNGNTCTQRVAQGSAGAQQLYMYDRNAPDTSGTVAVTIADSAAIISTTSYATGVDGASPRVDADGAAGTSTSPSVTSDSTTDGMAFTALSMPDSTTLTKDTSVTQIAAIDNFNGTIGGGGGDIAMFSGYETPGGSTNTVTHTLGASSLWRIGQITLRAASAPAASPRQLLLMGVGQ